MDVMLIVLKMIIRQFMRKIIDLKVLGKFVTKKKQFYFTIINKEK